MFPAQPTKWSNRLAFDIALALEGSGETVDEIKDRHGATASDLLAFNKDPFFLKTVEDYRGEIRDKGITFKLKARAQAEELLITVDQMIHSQDVSHAVRADLIKSLVRWGGLDGKATDDLAVGGGPGGVKININFGGTMLPVTMTAEEGGGNVLEYTGEVW